MNAGEMTDDEREDFGPLAVWECKGVNSSEKLILHLIGPNTGFKWYGEKRWYHGSVPEIMEFCGMSRKTVYNNLNSMAEKGYLEYEKVRGGRKADGCRAKQRGRVAITRKIFDEYWNLPWKKPKPASGIRLVSSN